MMESVLHSIWTVLVFVCFVGIFIWAFSRRKKKEFDDVANSIFAEDKKPLNNKRDQE